MSLSKIQSEISALLARYVAQPDKALHFVGCMAIGALTSAGAQAMEWSVLAATLLAIWATAGISWAKERYVDKPHPEAHTWDGWDAYAGTLGGIAGAHAAVWIAPAALALLGA